MGKEAAEVAGAGWRWGGKAGAGIQHSQGLAAFLSTWERERHVLRSGRAGPGAGSAFPSPSDRPGTPRLNHVAPFPHAEVGIMEIISLRFPWGSEEIRDVRGTQGSAEDPGGRAAEVGAGCACRG